MNRLHLVVALFLSPFLGLSFVGTAQNQFTIDATKQPSPPSRGRGPFPGSATPGHSADLPIRVDLLFPTGVLRSDGTVPVDFVITNVGTESIVLPSSVNQNVAPTSRIVVLTLWLTSDAIKEQFFTDVALSRLVKIEIVGTSAELYGSSDFPQSLHKLAPNESVRVRASSRVQLNPGMHWFAAHAELLHVLHGNSEVIGTADAEVVAGTLSTPGTTGR